MDGQELVHELLPLGERAPRRPAALGRRADAVLERDGLADQLQADGAPHEGVVVVHPDLSAEEPLLP